MKDYSFGNYICALRTRLGLSQFQLGTLVGVSDKAVSKWENGDAKPRIGTCYRLAEVLGVSINELLSCEQCTATSARKELNKMNNQLWDQAYERLSIYGENPPALCWSRLAAEKAALSETDAIQGFALLGKIEERARQCGTAIFSVGTISCSFAAWLLGATKVNPLPPHYRCPKCGKTEFVFTAADGFDLPAKQCECGTQLLRDGHNIPFEGYAQAANRKAAAVDFRVAPSFKETAAQILRDFYAGKAEILPVILGDDNNEQPAQSEIYVVMTGERERPTLSGDGFWHAGNEEYWNWWNDESTYTLICDERLERIQQLQKATGAQIPNPLEHITPEMAETLYQKRRSNETYIETMTQYLPEDEMHNFDLLMKLDGFAHGSGVWSHRWLENGIEKWVRNGEKLVSEGRAAFCEIPAFREDIWNDVCTALVRNNIRDNGLALEVMETARMGKYYHRGMPASVECLLIELGLPEWYPEYLKNVLYLFPKGHGISLLLLEITLEWYAMNYPAEYQQIAHSIHI